MTRTFLILTAMFCSAMYGMSLAAGNEELEPTEPSTQFIILLAAGGAGAAAAATKE